MVRPCHSREGALGACESGGWDHGDKYVITCAVATLRPVERQVGDAVGLGREVRLEDEALVGSGLAVDGRLVHLSVLVG